MVLNIFSFQMDSILILISYLISTKTAYKNTSTVNKSTRTEEEKAAAIKEATEYYNKNAKPGSLAAKANMVKQYNEKNNK